MSAKNIAQQFLRACLSGISDKACESFSPLVSLFGINGKPMNLDKHYQFLPLYMLTYPPKMILMIARQLGKSTNMSCASFIRSAVLAYYRTLILQPRFEQIQRFNTMIYKPMGESCVLQEHFISNNELDRLALKQFRNGSMTLLSHMFLSANKLRGISNVSLVCIDELQDVVREFLPVVLETMSASEHWRTLLMTGTPTTTDTTLGLEWEDSSQAEWIIKCQSCGHFNIPTPDNDLIKMIGKESAICAKCGKLVNPVFGKYVHAYPDRQYTYPGYHISQTIHPLHCMNPRMWPDVLKKVADYTQMKLYNEVFGWPYDTSVVPLTRKDLLRSRNKFNCATASGIPTDLRETYRYIAIGIDWDGGGAISWSYTNIAVCGLRRDSNIIDCIYGERIRKGLTAREVSGILMDIYNRVRPDLLAYDAGGAGFLYRQYMLEAGMDDSITIPYKYSMPSAGDVIKFHKGVRDDNSLYYTLDKSRSLAILIEAVKSQAVTNPDFDEKDDKAVPFDLLNLIEKPKETSLGEIVYLIGKKASGADDYAHALNFACSAIWDHFQCYPKLGQHYDISKLIDETVKDVVEDDVWGDPNDWNNFSNNASGGFTTPGWGGM